MKLRRNCLFWQKYIRKVDIIKQFSKKCSVLLTLKNGIFAIVLIWFYLFIKYRCDCIFLISSYTCKTIDIFQNVSKIFQSKLNWKCPCLFIWLSNYLFIKLIKISKFVTKIEIFPKISLKKTKKLFENNENFSKNVTQTLLFL